MEVIVPLHQDIQFVNAQMRPNFSNNPFAAFSVSAPTSPRRAAAAAAAFPFDWEEAPGGTPKQHSKEEYEETEEEFAFDFGSQLTSPPVISAADELFEAGKIRPLKPPQYISSPRSPAATRHSSRGVFDKQDKLDDHPSRDEVTRERSLRREARKGTSRSLSPLRRRSDEDELASATPSTSSSTSKKWRLRDLFLFRSASEGRARGSSGGGKKEESRSSSFRSTAAVHEYHYTAAVSRAAATEEMKKKTALPYRRNGIFGFLKYNSPISGSSFSRRK